LFDFNYSDLPIIIFPVALMRSARIARLIDAIPLSWLVGVQFYRVLGFMFLVLWWDGHWPWQFALPGRYWRYRRGCSRPGGGGHDCAQGFLCPRAAYAWCLFGIADLMVAVTMGTLTTPGRIHRVALDAPNMLISAFPLVMIPTFAVPLSIYSA